MKTGLILLLIVCFAATGLTFSTTYTWRVFAVSEGALSTALQGVQGTSPPGEIASTPAGGNWSATTTWVGGQVPTSGDNVTISDGSTVFIDTAAVALNLTVGTGGAPATLEWESATARTLVLGGSATIAGNGIFRSPAAGTVVTHALTVPGNLTNNGVLDFSTNSDTAGAAIIFTGATPATFGGNGATTDLRALTVNKGAQANQLDLVPANLTVRGVTTDAFGFLTLTSGTLRIGGTYAVTNRLFTTAAYTIGATAGLWLDNPNFTVAPTASGTTTLNNGLLRISQGTYNVGLGIADGMGGTTGLFRIEGGTLNASGRIDAAAFSLTERAAKAKASATAGMTPGEKLFYERCTLCHVPREPGDFTVKQWQGITESMFPRAGLTEDERKLVLDFLHKNARAD